MPGIVPLVALETPSWKKWLRSACVSSLDTSSSSTQRWAAPTTQPMQCTNHTVYVKHPPPLAFGFYNADTCNIEFGRNVKVYNPKRDKWTQIKIVFKYQAFYGFLIKDIAVILFKECSLWKGSSFLSYDCCCGCRKERAVLNELTMRLSITRCWFHSSP